MDVQHVANRSFIFLFGLNVSAICIVLVAVVAELYVKRQPERAFRVVSSSCGGGGLSRKSEEWTEQGIWSSPIRRFVEMEVLVATPFQGGSPRVMYLMRPSGTFQRIEGQYVCLSEIRGDVESGAFRAHEIELYPLLPRSAYDDMEAREFVG